MSLADKDGYSSREILEGQLERARKSGRDQSKEIAELEAELAGDVMPVELRYLFRSYWRIRRRKGGNGFGPSPIEWPDIDAFLRHSRVALAPWEVEIIEELDDAFMIEQAKAQREKKT